MSVLQPSSIRFFFTFRPRHHVFPNVFSSKRETALLPNDGVLPTAGVFTECFEENFLPNGVLLPNSAHKSVPFLYQFLVLTGTIDKYKDRLVAKGYTQKDGEDFFDTYSPVARITTIRVLLSLAASYGLIVHQMDVKTAFLNGELDEEIYMDQPDGFVVKGEEQKVCELLKSLYGLKQAPKQWHEKFDTTLTSAGYFVEADRCMYYRHGGGHFVILCLYVDDIIIFGTNMDITNEVKSFLSKSFDMKDLGEADVILYIKLIKEESGITLSQYHYVEKVLSCFGYMDNKPSPTPYYPSVTL
jgi:hypothetical protein